MFLATALAQRGWRVRVHERSDPLRMFGAGIFLWENGLRALNAIGVLPDILETKPELVDSETRGYHDRLVKARRTGPRDRLIVPRRIDVYNALVAGAAAAGVEITTGSQVVAATPEGELQLADGTAVKADLVVGADGVRSKVRDSLNLATSVEDSGLGAIRVLIPRLPEELDPAVVDPAMVEYWKGSRSLLFGPVNPTTIYLCFVCSVDDERGKAIPLDKDTWKSTFPNLSSAIDRVGDGARWDVFTTVRCASWHRGRAAIVGDAAHGLPPSLGQAANVTFGNCLMLAAYVSADLDIDRALTSWERAARPITDHTQLWSDRYMAMAALCPPSMEAVRTYALRVVASTPVVARALKRPMRAPLAMPSPHPCQPYRRRSGSRGGPVVEHVDH